MHKYFNLLERTYNSIPDRLTCLKQKMVEHYFHTAPALIDSCPVPAKRRRKSNQDVLSEVGERCILPICYCATLMLLSFVYTILGIHNSRRKPCNQLIYLSKHCNRSWKTAEKIAQQRTMRGR